MWPYPGRPGRDRRRACASLAGRMSHKNAMAGIELGGGKTVIIGDSRTAKTPAMFEAVGRAVESLGRPLLGGPKTSASARRDLAHARRQTRFIAGLEGHPAASGDPSPVTAEGGEGGGIELCVRRALGRSLSEVTVAIQGRRPRRRAAGRQAGGGRGRATGDLRRGRRGGSRPWARPHRRPRSVPPEADLRRRLRRVRALRAFGGAVFGGHPAAAEGQHRRRRGQQSAGGHRRRPGPGSNRGLLYAPDFVINGGGIHQRRRRDPRPWRGGEAFGPSPGSRPSSWP